MCEGSGVRAREGNTNLSPGSGFKSFIFFALFQSLLMKEMWVKGDLSLCTLEGEGKAAQGEEMGGTEAGEQPILPLPSPPDIPGVWMSLGIITGHGNAAIPGAGREMGRWGSKPSLCLPRAFIPLPVPTGSWSTIQPGACRHWELPAGMRRDELSMRQGWGSTAPPLGFWGPQSRAGSTPSAEVGRGGVWEEIPPQIPARMDRAHGFALERPQVVAAIPRFFNSL